MLRLGCSRFWIDAMRSNSNWFCVCRVDISTLFYSHFLNFPWCLDTHISFLLFFDLFLFLWLRLWIFQILVTVIFKIKYYFSWRLVHYTFSARSLSSWLMSRKNTWNLGIIFGRFFNFWFSENIVSKSSYSLLKKWS